MNILIDKAGFTNKGAELMFCSVVDKIKRQYPSAQIFIPAQFYTRGGYNYCLENGIRPIDIKTKTINVIQNSLSGLAMKLGLCRKKAHAHLRTIDLVIDAGGFRFGDQFKHGASYLKNTTRFYKLFKKECKFVFMPQSFGPFKNEGSQKTIAQVLKYAGLIFVREESSMKYMQEIAPNDSRIKFSRDFTLLHKYDTYLTPQKDYVVFVVNKRMITHTSMGEGVYMNYMCELVKYLYHKGENVYLLNHEGMGDLELCQQITKELNLNIPILSGLNSMQVKNVIAKAKLVVSSRFHGVVSGIVQRVPTLCTSWSHKYNELLSLYELDSNLLNMSDIEESKGKLTDALSCPSKYITTETKIAQEKANVEQMWQEIFSYIDQNVCK